MLRLILFITITALVLSIHSRSFASTARDEIIEAVKNDDNVRVAMLKARSKLGLGKLNTDIQTLEIDRRCGPVGCMARTLVIIKSSNPIERTASSVFAIARTDISGEKIQEVTLVQVKPKYPIRKETKSASFQKYSTLTYWDHLFVEEF